MTNLYTECKSCNKQIKIKSWALTRPDLQMEKGDEFSVNCQNCGVVEKKHINDVKAESNNIILFLSIAIGVLLTIFLLIVFGLIGTVSVAIPILIWEQHKKATKTFNSYMIRRK